MFDVITPDWTIPDVETVIFDKDGTLIDVHRYWGRIIEMRANEITQMFNISLDSTGGICRAMGWDRGAKRLMPEGPIALVSRAKVIQTVSDFLLERHKIKFCVPVLEHIFDDVNRQFQKEMLEHIRILPGVYSLLERMKQAGAKMGIVTSDSVETVPKILAYLELTGYFDVIIGRESSEFPKESGQPCKMAMDALKADSWHTVVIGDTPVDCQMARMNGAQGIGVATGQISRNELGKHTLYTTLDLELFVIGTRNG